jgi:HD superfamily phosphohydrolase
MEMHLSRPAGALGYSYADPLADGVVRDDPLLKLLLTTRAVRRLKSIRFLGGIDYVLVPWPNASGRNKRYTRHQHSLGVTRLAALYSAEQQLSEHEFRVVCAAALLHDVGHAPLSHSLEPIFYEYFGVEHHRTSEDIICGRVPIGRDVYNYLRAYHVDVEHVAALATGRESGFHDFFGGPINFDTIEAILRCRVMVGPVEHLPTPEEVTCAALRRASEMDRRLVDSFWAYKDQMYRYLINSPAGVLSDAVCQAFMRSNIARFSAVDYLSTEREVFSKLPGLRRLLRSRIFTAEAAEYVPAELPFMERTFFVDPATNFFARDDTRRYRQRKELRRLAISRSDHTVHTVHSRPIRIFSMTATERAKEHSNKKLKALRAVLEPVVPSANIVLTCHTLAAKRRRSRISTSLSSPTTYRGIQVTLRRRGLRKQRI